MGKKNKKVKFPLTERFRAAISKNGEKWALEWLDDSGNWMRISKGKILDSDPQFLALTKGLVVETPKEALKISIGVQRARASIPG